LLVGTHAQRIVRALAWLLRAWGGLAPEKCFKPKGKEIE